MLVHAGKKRRQIPECLSFFIYFKFLTKKNLKQEPDNKNLAPKKHRYKYK